jgi:excisionase family DNA binding protein
MYAARCQIVSGIVTPRPLSPAFQGFDAGHMLIAEVLMLTIAEAARLLAVPYQTLYARVRRTGVETTRLGNYRMLDAARLMSLTSSDGRSRQTSNRSGRPLKEPQCLRKST